MTERWFCWFDNYSPTANRRVSIFFLCVRESVHMLQIALFFNRASMCESEGVTERRVAKAKQEVVRVSFSAASDIITE